MLRPSPSHERFQFTNPAFVCVCVCVVLGFKLYLDTIFTPYAPVARAAILNCIERERNMEEQDRHLLQESVNVFLEMGYNYNNQKLAVIRTLHRHAATHTSPTLFFSWHHFL